MELCTFTRFLNAKLLIDNTILWFLYNFKNKKLKEYSKLWKRMSCILNLDNAPSHTALFVKKILNISVKPFTIFVFYLFPKIKSAVKGIRFLNVEAVKE